MPPKTYTDEEKFHHYMGIELNNQTWALLTKKNRNDKDDLRMIRFAEGSLYHWLRSPMFEKINEQRGEWMLSHVFAVLGKGDQALEAAEKCMALTEEFGYTDFDLGYALEGTARAYAACGNHERAIEYFERANQVGQEIKKEKDRKLFLADLTEGPWFDSGLPK
ncbi:MAG: tetratricopeptide repeat protein [Fidelibacterota bacterium]